MTLRHLTYLLLALGLAAVAGLEVLHAYSQDDPTDALCMAPQSKAEAFREMLLLHIHGH